MSQIGRNDPCPCGSGKKYKQCCLRRQTEDRRLTQLELESVPVALEWLLDHHQEDCSLAVSEGFFGALDDEMKERLDELPDELQQMVATNIKEWLVADACFGEGNQQVPAIDLVLGPGGPHLEEVQRAYLEVVRRRGLSLYEIIGVRPGEGLQVRDMTGSEDPAEAWVVERSASRSLHEGDMLGTRLVSVHGHWEISGEVYPTSQKDRLPLRRAVETVRRKRLPAERIRRLVGAAIIDSWLEGLTAPPPRVVDASTGEPLLFVTDHYRVLDWDRLAAGLEKEPDVEGDREEGWTRFKVDRSNPDIRRSRLAVNLNERKKDRIETFARTKAMADEGRKWFRAVAGDSVEFISREITDPTHSVGKAESRAPKSKQAPAAPTLPEGLTQQMLMEHVYGNWADQSIPILGGKTPRQAAKTAKGKRDLVELLKSYEYDDRRRSRETGETLIDFNFLWQSVGLDRHEHMG